MATLASRIQTRLLSWWQATPLPDQDDAPCRFQPWHEFDAATASWVPMEPRSRRARPSAPEQVAELADLGLVTWNVDATASMPQKRADGIVTRILALRPAVDVVFLQEVSRAALAFMLDDARIRSGWYSSDVDGCRWGGQAFGTVTLVSRRRFAAAVALGPVWRVKYPSRFGRDALCCDIFTPVADPALDATRVRLVNVHLDSLPIRPSRRPRQVAAVVSLLRSAGRGLAAGDFNPVLPEDDTLVQDHGLTDAWDRLHGRDPGFTWGLDGKQPFPPSRLDKVTTLDMQVVAVDILNPEMCTDSSEPWSDHCGLWCRVR